MQQLKPQKLSTGTLFSYGIGAMGEGIGYNVFFSFFSFFLTTQAGVQPAIAGTISAIAVLWDAITDPFIGNWSDKTKNPKGRRRPFIMSGAIFFGVAIALLFVNVDLPGGLKVAYYIIVNMFYWLALTTCVIPHISLGSELSEDFDERTKLRTFAVSIMGIGTLIAVGTPLLLVKAFTGMESPPVNSYTWSSEMGPQVLLWRGCTTTSVCFNAAANNSFWQTPQFCSSP